MGTQTNASAILPRGASPPRAEAEPFPDSPQHEAAFFYGLFLRGHSLEKLRHDIAVPERIVTRWQRLWRDEPVACASNARMLSYRRRVLATFNSLVSLEAALSHLRQ